jgi:YfiH family protein
MTAPFLISKRLSELKGVRHAFFTRKGGVSTGVYDSLNTGPGSNDDADAVAENRRRAAEALGLGAEALVTCYQIHSTMTRVTEQPWGDRRPEGDAVVTRTPGVLCGALSADCAPVLMVDPQARVVAAVHAGWKGALDGVVQSAVKAMEAEGARADRIVAAVGPCIAQSSYEVGPEFLQRFAAHDPGSERFFKRAPTPGRRAWAKRSGWRATPAPMRRCSSPTDAHSSRARGTTGGCCPLSQSPETIEALSPKRALLEARQDAW